MQDRREYWKGREKRAVEACRHTEEMERLFADEIKESMLSATVYGPGLPFMPEEEKEGEEKGSKATILDTDSVSAAMEYGGEDTAVLNFASYKNPGGMFLQGSKAQEECLCHASTLYNVLRHFDPDNDDVPCESDFYGWNRLHKNRSLYQHRALYTPGIVFREGERQASCSVITCAAPNKSAAQKHCNVTDRENRKALWERIQFVFRVAEVNHIHTLILGAYGCGVFGQDPKEVASLIKEYISRKPTIPEVIIAIPDGADGNLEAFREVFGEEQGHA